MLCASASTSTKSSLSPVNSVAKRGDDDDAGGGGGTPTTEVTPPPPRRLTAPVKSVGVNSVGVIASPPLPRPDSTGEAASEAALSTPSPLVVLACGALAAAAALFGKSSVLLGELDDAAWPCEERRTILLLPVDAIIDGDCTEVAEEDFSWSTAVVRPEALGRTEKGCSEKIAACGPASRRRRVRGMTFTILAEAAAMLLLLAPPRPLLLVRLTFIASLSVMPPPYP